MVDIYATETEQVEQIKKLWREYGIATLVGVLIALIVGFGWRHWQERREHILEHASMRYEQLVTNAVNGNSDAVENIAIRLIGRYPQTPYAEFAALQLARQDVYQGKLDDAAERLDWAMKEGGYTRFTRSSKNSFGANFISAEKTRASVRVSQKSR